MAKIKNVPLYLLIILLIAGTTLHGQAMVKDSDKKTAEKVPAPPIVVNGDELYFSDSTGDMFAKGNVVVDQAPSQVLGDLMRGNAKQNEIWIDDNAVFIQPGTNVVGKSIRYNYKTRYGSMANAKGKVDAELIAGNNIEFMPDEVIIYDATTTRCPAKVPDMHMSATKVEIWPGDKLIAYNAKFWIKDKVIYSIARYQKSLREDAKSEYPRLGYSSNDGMSISQHLEYPLDKRTSLFFDPSWYTKAGWKPSFGINHSQNGYLLSAVEGHYRDSNSNWIKKEPELKLSLGSRIGDSPISYSFYALQGKWIDHAKSSWHQDYSLYFSRDAIKFNDKLHLYLGTGVQKIYESYDGSGQNIFRYDATLYEYWNPKLTTYVGYHYTRNNQTLFAYGKTDLAKSLDAGFTYKIDRLNSIGFAQSYDMTNHRVFDQDYFWYRDLHCWQMTFEYRAKRQQFIVDINVKRF